VPAPTLRRLASAPLSGTDLTNDIAEVRRIVKNKRRTCNQPSPLCGRGWPAKQVGRGDARVAAIHVFAPVQAILNPHPEEECGSNPSRRSVQIALDPPSRRLLRRLLRMRSVKRNAKEDVDPRNKSGDDEGGC